jgi:phosphate transport system substrate-binding protein
MFIRRLTRLALAGAASAAVAAAAHAAEISGAGATFPYPIYAKWADAYKKETGLGLNYQSIGSGGGIKQIKAKTVTFGASDMPLKPEELEAAGLIQFPMIMGGVAPVVNLDGLKPGEIKLDGPTLASIYMGEIAKWDDAKIKKLNPDVKLPSTAIAPIYRSDGSGTNFLFTDYLSKASPTFKEKIGANTSVQWPVGIGAKGNEGVANMAKRTKGAIGYVEYAYAKQTGMAHLTLINGDGKAVEPSSETFQAAAANADWKNAKDYYVILTNEPGAKSWPITGASFILMYKEPQDPAASKQALDFFAWAYKNGGKMAEELAYVPIPDNVVGMVKETWKSEIKAAAN